MRAAFPSFEDDGPSTHCKNLAGSIDQLACEWRGITIRSTGTSSEEIAQIPADLHRVCLNLLHFTSLR